MATNICVEVSIGRGIPGHAAPNSASSVQAPAWQELSRVLPSDDARRCRRLSLLSGHLRGV